jgi:AbiU2
LKTKLATLLAIALKASEFCRDWRNRYIAHRDLSLALNALAEPLAEASKKQMDEALKALSDVPNAVGIYYKKSETRFDMAARHGGAVNLLYVLYDGAKAQDARAKRLEAGEPSEEDLLPRAL